MDEKIAIQIKGLSKCYPVTRKKIGITIGERIHELFAKRKSHNENDFYALKDVNLTIYKGESVGIIGRNGAGKSTLLKILAEVVEPSEGSIEINGTVASVLEIGMGFHPELTGRENVYLSGAMLGMPKSTIARRFDEIVEFAGVGNFIDTPVKHYSSGMYLRLAFAVVVNVDADILLFDEVLSVGDLSYQTKCLKKIREMSLQNKTIVFVGHNVSQIAEFCQTIFWFKNGFAYKCGSREIINDYFEDSQRVETPINTITNQLQKEFRYTWSFNWLNNNAPGDSNFKLLGMYIKNESRQKSNTILTSDQISINLVYETSYDGDFYDIGVLISNMNVTYLGCHTLISNIEIDKFKMKGKYLATVYFERDFFNETHLQIGYSVTRNNEKIICIDYNILYVKIDLHIEEKEINYYKNIPVSIFPLRPKKTWELKRID